VVALQPPQPLPQPTSQPLPQPTSQPLPQPLPQQTSQLSSIPPPPGKVVKKLVVGNTHMDVVNPTDNNVHQWTFSVKFEDPSVDIGSIIDRIIVQLHPTFPNPTIELTQPPFETTQKGWGLFNITAIIHFKADQNKLELPVTHYLSFDNAGKFSTYDITINAGSVSTTVISK